MTDLTRLEELVARYATEGLSASETMEMRRLLEAEPEWDVEEFELAAAALDLAIAPSEEAIPEEVRARVLANVQQEVQQETEAQKPASPPAPPVLADRREASPSKRSWTVSALPWLAAAAALLIAVVGWWPQASVTPEVVATDSERRQQLAERPGTLLRGWTATEDPAAGGASGDVVWSDAEQRGYMRISGLAVNNPTREQYQLWIFDRERDERYPVDGGVFDMPSDAAEVLVPIDAKLPVGEPYLFAVTVEPPGGVVVSSRERIVLVAEV